MTCQSTSTLLRSLGLWLELGWKFIDLWAFLVSGYGLLLRSSFPSSIGLFLVDVVPKQQLDGEIVVGLLVCRALTSIAVATLLIRVFIVGSADVRVV